MTALLDNGSLLLLLTTFWGVQPRLSSEYFNTKVLQSPCCRLENRGIPSSRQETGFSRWNIELIFLSKREKGDFPLLLVASHRKRVQPSKRHWSLSRAHGLSVVLDGVRASRCPAQMNYGFVNTHWRPGLKCIWSNTFCAVKTYTKINN